MIRRLLDALVPPDDVWEREEPRLLLAVAAIFAVFAVALIIAP